jgi:uncharacterized integral membrane protein
VADGAPAPREPRPRWRPTARQVIAAIILVLILVFALVNLEHVKVDLVFGELNTQVFFVIAVPAVLGFIAGLIVQRQRDRRRR